MAEEQPYEAAVKQRVVDAIEKRREKYEILQQRKEAMNSDEGKQAIRDALQQVTEYATQHDEKGEPLSSTLNENEVKPYWENEDIP